MLAWLDYWTILLVLFVALLLFGSRLPEVARSLGRSLNEFKRGMNEVRDEIGREPPAEDRFRERRELRPPDEQSANRPTVEPTKEAVPRSTPNTEDQESPPAEH